MTTETFDKKNIIAIILTGKRDFGRCPIASSHPVALWPIMGKSALQCLLDSLAEQSVTQAIICSYGDSLLLKQEFSDYHRLKLTFLEEELPLGTAGCIRYAVEHGLEPLGHKECQLLVFQGSMVSPPKIDPLLEMHEKKEAILTVGLNPAKSGSALGSEAAGVYMCDPEVLKFIPEDGFCDIKETLIPALLQADKTIEAITFLNSVGNFREKSGYLAAMTERMTLPLPERFSGFNDGGQLQDDAWIDPSAQVDSTAVIFGPVVILEQAKVEEGAVICGPTVIEKNAYVGKNTLIDHCMIWPEARIGNLCEVQRCLIDKKTCISTASVLKDQGVVFVSKGMFRCSVEFFSAYQLLAIATLVTALFYSYWPQIVDLVQVWMRSDEYGCGALVPIVAVSVLWMRRHRFAKCSIKPAILWGVLALILIQMIRFYGLYSWSRSLERLSLVMTIIALVLMLFGWKVLRRSLSVLLFLFLMIPLPNRVQFAITQPLQSWATHSAVYALEVLDYDVIRQGNVIQLRSSEVHEYTSVAVAEACNGLRMVTAFFVVCGLVILIYPGPFWHKLLGIISCLPIALLCNTIRLVVTAIMFTILDGPQWELFFHDFGGYAMMPLAIVAIVLEFWFLSRLFMVASEQGELLYVQRHA